MLKRYLIVLMFLIAGCTSDDTSVPLPIEFDRGDSCRVCGMINVDIPGAKAQIHYEDGNIDKFCCTLHMFSFYLQPDRPLNVSVVYVSDMAKADKTNPAGHWIDAGEAFYVYGGSVKGTHGEALVPFAFKNDAGDYVKKNGGKVVRFDEITMEMLRPSGRMGEMTGNEHSDHRKNQH